jgi:hypothetical protein
MVRPKSEREGFAPKYDDETSEAVAREVSSSLNKPYVPMPRPVTGEALITTGRDPLRIPVAVDTSSPRGVQIASDINSILNADRYSKSDAEKIWDQLPKQTQDTLTQIARSQGGRSGKAYWERKVAASYVSSKQGEQVNPWQFIEQDLSGASLAATGGSSGGRGGRTAAYTGPVQSITVQAESDVRSTANAVAMEMLGRGVSDEEFKRILNRTRKAEQAQPQVATTSTGMSTTEQGLTAEGRKDIIENIIAKKPEYQEFQKATTLMSWFDRALQERMQ